MGIKAYGYLAKADAHSLQGELAEVTIVADPDELRQIAKFLNDAATEIETHGAVFEHEHLRDVIEDWPEENTDLIISRGT